MKRYEVVILLLLVIITVFACKSGILENKEISKATVISKLQDYDDSWLVIIEENDEVNIFNNDSFFVGYEFMVNLQTMEIIE